MTPQTHSDSGEPLRRWAFILRIKPGAEEAYDRAHAEVWPEMLALLSGAGISEYSIFRRDQMLFLTFRAVDFEATWKRLEDHPVNLSWQQAMSPYFAALDEPLTTAGLHPGERFPMMEEVFYMP
jgi:L-rhamnose mutarotase